jgi:periplasmic protein TonB
MFRYIVESPAPVDRRKAFVLPISILSHLIVVAAAVAIPLFAPGVLPVPVTTLIASINSDIVTPPPPPAAPVAHTNRAEPPSMDTVSQFAAPIVSPRAVGPEPVGDATRGLIRGVEGGDGTALGEMLGVVVDAPPPPPAPPEPSKPIRVGSGITRPAKIRDVMPVYPALAQAARISGMVIVEATIGPSGDVLDARVLRSIPLLDAAALNAVRQWRFTPTLLNGQAVAVVMTVTVDFKLQ